MRVLGGGLDAGAPDYNIQTESKVQLCDSLDALASDYNIQKKPIKQVGLMSWGKERGYQRDITVTDPCPGTGGGRDAVASDCSLQQESESS